VVVPALPLVEFPKITPIIEKDNPYADQSEDFDDKYLLKEL